MTLNSNGIAQNYNKIVKRIRDFWVNYFLQFVYKIDLSLSYFELWVYRGKQLGIINANEFYPGFNGKIVYPTSLLMKEKAHSDFKNCLHIKMILLYMLIHRNGC